MPFPARRPSAAMIVATTALISSLAGPAAADQVARMAQAIDSSADIANGVITSADIKNETISSVDVLNGGLRTEDIGTGQVTTPDLGTDSVRGDKVLSNTLDGSDIQDETLKGEDIHEGTLGKVPNASFADLAQDARTLDGFDSSAFALAGETDTFNFELGKGQQRVIKTSGPISLVAACEEEEVEPRSSRNRKGTQQRHRGKGSVTVLFSTLYARSTADGAFATSVDADDEDFGPEDGDRYLLAAGDDDDTGRASYGGFFSIVAPGTESISGDAAVYANRVDAGTCGFGGGVIVG